jgi:hypothetical protein
VHLTLSQWHLKEVEVSNTQSGVSYLFTCDKWLSLEAAERNGPDANFPLVKNEGVKLERFGESQTDVRVFTVLPCSRIQLNTPVLYRFFVFFFLKCSFCILISFSLRVVVRTSDIKGAGTVRFFLYLSCHNTNSLRGTHLVHLLNKFVRMRTCSCRYLVLFRRLIHLSSTRV